MIANFDTPVAPNGYRWLYADAVSEGHDTAVVVIAMLGNVFSPRYARARARGGAPDPLDFCTVNVALYDRLHARWALTEVNRERVRRGARFMCIGSSTLEWDGATLTLDLDERTPFRGRGIQGRVRVTATSAPRAPERLDLAGEHHWCAFMPKASVSVDLSEPGLSFRADGYADTNWGTAPLESAFRSWVWSRTIVAGRSHVQYRCVPRVSTRTGVPLPLAYASVDLGGHDLPSVVLPKTRWGLARSIGSESGAARVIRTLEDTPFYARSIVEHRVDASDAVAVHEVVSFDRFLRPWVRGLVPFRMRNGRVPLPPVEVPAKGPHTPR